MTRCWRKLLWLRAVLLATTVLSGPALGQAVPGSNLTSGLADQRKKVAAQFDKGSRWAIIVGVNKYDDPKTASLRFCVNDADLMADVLAKRCGYLPENLLLMTDTQPPELQPTKENLLKQIPQLLKKTKGGDTILVYFAGHGAEFRGQSFLLPRDFDGGNALLSSFKVDDLRDMLHASNATQKLLVLDCCHSGGAKGGVTLGLSGEDLEGIKGAGGLITLTGSRKTQTSLESAEKRHGVFTFCLAKGLGGDADVDKDGIVDSDELYRYVFVEVPVMANQVVRGHAQQPVRIIGEDVVGVFALSRVAGEAYIVPELKAGQVITNSIGMKVAVIMPGRFTIGSPENEAGRDEDERQMLLEIGRIFLIGVHEVTQGEFERVMKKNPSYFSASGEGASAVEGLSTSRYPVEQVSWAEAIEFCKKLSELPEEKAAGRAYRLPTEAEWEFACRAGSTAVFNVGELLSPNEANVDGDKPYLNAADGTTLKRTSEVGRYKPNAWGLFDMHGNVAEWCNDWYTEHPYAAPTIDPSGPASGDRRIVRGGSYSGDVALARSASRRDRDPEYRHRTYGFRVVCVAAELENR